MNDQQEHQQNNSPEQPELSKKERRELRRQERQAAQTSAHRAGASRRIALWAIALLAIAGSAYGVYYLASNSPSPDTGNGSLTNTVSDADWVHGNPVSSVTLVEYADFQCPACAQYHPMVKALEQEFGGDVQFIFRHFPLTRIHPNAVDAGKAAEAAGQQGKFWEMRDILFERQTEWSPKPRPQATFIGYAQELGLDVGRFEDDMDRDDIEDKIDAHAQSGFASGVNATPTFFLNGEKMDTPRSYDEFRQAIAQAIATATPTPDNNAAKDEAEVSVTSTSTSEKEN